ncbi:MAG: putative PEP-binding protein [archaeon]|jgi:phosphoenolpyruvate synthase/pyruvate phosphate dikinase
MVKIKIGMEREMPTKEEAKLFDGVSLIKGGKGNPTHNINQPERIKEISTYLDQLCSSFKGKDVWYRLGDLLTFQVNALIGCEEQINELNPLMGLRGIRRALTFPASLKKELEMIVTLRKKHKNLHLLIPFVHAPIQIIELKKHLKEANYSGRLGVMIELPSAALTVTDFIKLGIDYIVVGTNDLHDFTYGISRRDNVKERIHQDKEYVALRKLLKQILAKKNKKVEYVVSVDLHPVLLDYVSKMNYDSISIPYNVLQKNPELREKFVKLKKK